MKRYRHTDRDGNTKIYGGDEIAQALFGADPWAADEIPERVQAMREGERIQSGGEYIERLPEKTSPVVPILIGFAVTIAAGLTLNVLTRRRRR